MEALDCQAKEFKSDVIGDRKSLKGLHFITFNFIYTHAQLTLE